MRQLTEHKRRKHSLAVRWRAFSIWRHLGFLPWRKPKAATGDSDNKDFYKGAFDSIPFLNDDAKRTFQHLLLRPGYMIRDYIRGEHDRYLAPLTSLIIFYAFFALVAAVLQPVQHRPNYHWDIPAESSQDSVEIRVGDLSHLRISSDMNPMMKNVAEIVQRGYITLHLDQYPEAVKTHRQSALAALEATLRSQGIPLFLSEFLFLWLAMSMALRRYKMGMSACAAASAYVLCQFSFFMLFAVLLTWGKSTSISVLLMLFLLVLDYHQWLDVSWKKGVKLAVSTGILYAVIYGLVILLISLVVLIVAFFQARM